MKRLFDEHIVRNTRSLDGAWRIKRDDGNVGITEEWYKCALDGESVTVPSTWNTYGGLLTYEGAVWYEKEFYNAGGTLRLVFEGVMTECDVWLDGEHIGYHYGGFSAFDFIIPDTAAGTRRLTLRVDNRFNEKSIPQAFVDWYHYGGITRSVTAEWLSGAAILSSKLVYTLSDDLTHAVCNFEAELYGDCDVSDELTCTLDGRDVAKTSFLLKKGERKTIKLPSFVLGHIELWSPDTPRLYNVKFSTSTDDLHDRTGFRKIEIKNGKPHLNGIELEFRGVNRHEEHPEFGMAFPSALMRRDAELIEELGCNIIRGSHYPNAKEFIDLLDERGILFWSEIPIWGVGFKEAVLADSDVEARGLTMHREMLAQYFNHPSIVIWGMHNETPSHTKTVYNLTKRYREFISSADTSRLIVFASNHPFDDLCFEFSDIACVNMYYGWYHGYEEGAWEKFLEKFTARLDALGFSDKPIAISEFGAAALYGTHDSEDILWCEEYQARLIGNCLELFHENPRVVGSFIWQFADIRTSRETGLNRARSFNNKGIMNEYRKPKLAFREAKKLYNSFKNQ